MEQAGTALNLPPLLTTEREVWNNWPAPLIQLRPPPSKLQTFSFQLEAKTWSGSFHWKRTKPAKLDKLMSRLYFLSLSLSLMPVGSDYLSCSVVAVVAVVASSDTGESRPGIYSGLLKVKAGFGLKDAGKELNAFSIGNLPATDKSKRHSQEKDCCPTYR